MHIGSYDKMNNFKNQYLSAFKNKRLKILDLGSQDVNGSYQEIFRNPNWEYVGCDMVAGNNVDIVLNDVYNWEEIPANTFDVVVSGQTFEHIEYFWITIYEIMRVLKPHGLCCIIAPSSGVEHRYPVDCWRWYPDGFRALAKYVGLEVVEVYTQWENVAYADGSGFWKDSVLIAKKPQLSKDEEEIFNYKNYLSRLLLPDNTAGKDEFKPHLRYLLNETEYKAIDKLITDIIQKENVEENIKQLMNQNLAAIADVVLIRHKKWSADAANIFNMLVVLFAESGDLKGAQFLLNSALQVKENNPDTLYNQAYVFYKQGNKKEALKSLMRIKEKDEQVESFIKNLKNN